MRQRISIGLSILAIFVLSRSVFATTIDVPGEYATIQAGIDAASPGDTVLVAPGTYSGEGNRNLDFGGVNLVLLADGGGQVTIDCSSTGETHRAVYLHNGEDSTSVIEGFWITGANVTGYYGGAVSFENAGGTVRNCLIVNNDCYGITATSTAPNYTRHRVFIEGCSISGNHKGIVSIANGVIGNCSVSGNDSVGIQLYDMDSVTVTGCTIIENGQYGIATYTGGWGNYAITNNTIVLNGTGYYFWYDPPKEDVDRTDRWELSLISANLFAFNSDKGFESDGLGLNGAVAECNNAFGNPGGDWATMFSHEPQAGDENGNLALDPQFCDLDTAFSISSASPCFPANNDCGVLIGAYGVGCGFLCGDVNGNGFGPNVSDVTYLIAYLFRSGPAPVSDVADVNNDDDLNVSDLTYLLAYLFRGGPEPVCW